MKVYDIVKNILLTDEKARNSDLHLMYEVWKVQGYIDFTYDEWMKKCAHPKSIIESRRNIQRDQEAKLKEGKYIPSDEIVIANATVRKYRGSINEQKGTHIFRDEVLVPIDSKLIEHKQIKVVKNGRVYWEDVK